MLPPQRKPLLPLGGDTSVRTIRKRTNMPTMAPSLLMRSMSVILTAFADLTRNMTDILQLLLVEVGGEEVNNCEPPGFQHQCAVGESKSNLSEPDPECAGDHVRPRVEDQCLQQTKSQSNADVNRNRKQE